MVSSGIDVVHNISNCGRYSKTSYSSFDGLPSGIEVVKREIYLYRLFLLRLRFKVASFILNVISFELFIIIVMKVHNYNFQQLHHL